MTTESARGKVMELRPGKDAGTLTNEQQCSPENSEREEPPLGGGSSGKIQRTETGGGEPNPGPKTVKASKDARTAGRQVLGDELI